VTESESQPLGQEEEKGESENAEEPTVDISESSETDDEYSDDYSSEAGSESEEEPAGSGEEEIDPLEDEQFSGNTYSVVVEQSGGEGLNEPVSFTVTFTEIGSSRIGSVEIKVPDDYTNLSDLEWSTSHGGMGDGQWDGQINGNIVTLWAKTVEQYLYFGQWLAAEFKAVTPAAITAEAQWKDDDDNVINENVGIYEFEVQAWTNALDENDEPLHLGSLLEGAKTGSSLNTMSEDHSQLKSWVLDTEPYADSDINTVNVPSPYHGEVSYDTLIKSVTENGGVYDFSLEFNYYRNSSPAGVQHMRKIEIDIPAWLTITPGSLSSGWSIVDSKLVWTGDMGISGSVDLNFSGAIALGYNQYILTTGAYWHNPGGYRTIQHGENSSGAELLFSLPQLPQFEYLPLVEEPIDDLLFPDDEPESEDEDPETEDPETEDPDPDDPETDDPGVVLTAAPVVPVEPEDPEGDAEETAAPVDEAETEIEEEAEEEEVFVAAEPPQVNPVESGAPVVTEVSAVNLWNLLYLLLLVPVLLWFLLARLVLVRVPGKDGEYETVARKLASRKEKRWFVNVEKELDKHLQKHAEVLIDFRGGLIKEADKAVYSGETVLGKGDIRYALVNRSRSVTWVEKLQDELGKAV
jgi:hypothetical protein